jgi:hypothetical protein
MGGFGTFDSCMLKEKVWGRETLGMNFILHILFSFHLDILFSSFFLSFFHFNFLGFITILIGTFEGIR